jgi:hypothetical protein
MMPGRRALPWFLAGALSLCCGSPVASPPDGVELGFSRTAAVRVTPAGAGEWLLLFETLQPQSLVTTPMRSAGLLGKDRQIVRTYAAPEGWILVDAAAHPSGEASLLALRVDATAEYPLRAMVSRFGPGGALAQRELVRLPPPTGPEPGPAFMASLDRARLVAQGEDLFAVVRWANNSVQAYRLEGNALEQKWAAWVEPPAPLFFLGIIGGGFDNFHQGDSAFFVHADVDSQGDLQIGVASTGDVLASHDAFFGEDLLSQADPASFDFGVAIVTGIGAEGIRRPARLMGSPGRNKRLLNLRVAGDSVILVGRIVLPSGPAGRGNEAMSVRVGGGNQVAISGVQDAPGTHAAVYSDAFLVLRGPELF